LLSPFKVAYTIVKCEECHSIKDRLGLPAAIGVAETKAMQLFKIPLW
jgi:hypothetical protein